MSYRDDLAAAVARAEAAEQELAVLRGDNVTHLQRQLNDTSRRLEQEGQRADENARRLRAVGGEEGVAALRKRLAETEAELTRTQVLLEAAKLENGELLGRVRELTDRLAVPWPWR